MRILPWKSQNHFCFVIIVLLCSLEADLRFVVTIIIDSSILGSERRFCDLLKNLSLMGLVTGRGNDFSMEENNGEIGSSDPLNSLPAIATLREAN